MQEDIHLMLQEQRRREHMREAENHRCAKALRRARGGMSFWARISGRMNPAKRAEKPPITHSNTVCTVCEPAMSESM